MRKYNILFTGFAFWFVENMWFGWNSVPCCPAELYCDKIAGILVLWGSVKVIAATEAEKAAIEAVSIAVNFIKTIHSKEGKEENELQM